jgi:membrane protein DedA with SNARE-associated domain
MPIEFIHYVTEYGLIIIFWFLFLQEIGAPTPLPNEVVLIFSGYLAYSGFFILLEIIVIAFTADILAATFLYVIFHFLGKLFLNKKPKWFSISKKQMRKMAHTINQQGWKGIFIGRLTPFIRGYTAVICGVLHVKPSHYFFTIVITSSIWAVFYIAIGYLAAPHWNKVSHEIIYLPYLLLFIPAIIIIIFIVKLFKQKGEEKIYPL